MSDAAALSLSDDSRKALVSYLELVKGGAGIDKRVHTRYGKSSNVALHPMLGEALKTLSERFGELILEDQECFEKKEGWEKLLALLPGDEHGESIRLDEMAGYVAEARLCVEFGFSDDFFFRW